MTEAGEMRRIRYCQGECGWAEMLPDGTAKIANVPLAEELNMGDIVELFEQDGMMHAGKVLKRAFENKDIVSYKFPEGLPGFQKFEQEAEAAGACVEGMVEGIAIVSHNFDDWTLSKLLVNSGVILQRGDTSI